jgi:hypothetical protein
MFMNRHLNFIIFFLPGIFRLNGRNALSISFLSILIWLNFGLASDCSAQIITIPDPNFKAALLRDPSINLNQNSEIELQEAVAADTLWVDFNEINDLKGIENFVNLQFFSCSNNKLTKVDFSANTKLKLLNVGNNQLNGIDLSRNIELTYLDCRENNISRLNLDKIIHLVTLWCSSNQLDTLDFRNNYFLTNLGCSNNRIKYINIAHCIMLQYLDCSNNLLTGLNVGGARTLTTMNCKGNSSLSGVVVFELPLAQFRNYSRDLTTSWTIDATAAKSPELVPGTVFIPDPYFRGKLVTDSTINTNRNNFIEIAEAEAVKNISVTLSNISDLTGTEAFVNLENLYAGQNRLKTLELPANKLLKTIQCYLNQLTEIDLSANTALTHLNCSFNKLTTIDVSNNKSLIALDCKDNQIERLDLAGLSNLAVLMFDNNKIKSADMTGCVGIRSVSCKNNLLTQLNFGNSGLLASLDCTINPELDWVCVLRLDKTSTFKKDDHTYFRDKCQNIGKYVFIPDKEFKAYLIADTTINKDKDREITFEEAAAVKRLHLEDYSRFDNYYIQDIKGIEAFVNLEVLEIAELYYLYNIDISNNKKLRVLNVLRNFFSSLDVSGNPALDTLILQYGADMIRSLDLRSNSELSYLDTRGQANIAYICVPDIDAAENNPDFKKQPTTQWSENCELITGILPAEAETEELFYPNPAADVITIPEGSRITIFNQAGAGVMESDQQEVLIGELPSGLYMVKIQLKDGVIEFRKLIKS